MKNFSILRARWRENRTIFNTPNPRLMNVSLLRDNKMLHGGERRGSRMSVRIPSRQPSMASLRPHSPNASIGKPCLKILSLSVSLAYNKAAVVINFSYLLQLDLKHCLSLSPLGGLALQFKIVKNSILTISGLSPVYLFSLH